MTASSGNVENVGFDITIALTELLTYLVAVVFLGHRPPIT